MNFKDKRPIEDTIECIEALAEIVKKNDIGKLKINLEDMDIVIEGRSAVPAMTTAPAAAAAVAIAPQKAEMAVVEETGNIVTSPIIGTFYTSPAPDKPPFVKVGDTISAGDVVCIIESMKLMNEINSEFGGRVAEIYVNNGDAVEFGQKIMRIE